MHEFDLRRVDLNLLLVFEALMAERHVGNAARRLSLTQSATSHALGRLRLVLHDPLFVRWSRGVRPTERAEAIAPALASILRDIRLALGPPPSFDPATATRRFSIGATDYVSFVLLPKLMAHVRLAAPGVDFQVRPIDQASILRQLDDQEIDLALGLYRAPEKRIEVFPLFGERLVGVCRAGHPLLDAPLTPAGFAALPHLMVALGAAQRNGRRASGPVDDALQALGLERRVVLTVPHFLVAPFVIARSDLVAALGERIALEWATMADLAVFECPVPTPSWQIHAIRLRVSASDPGNVWLADTLQQLCAGI